MNVLVADRLYDRIEGYCNEHAAKNGQPQFQLFDNLHPVVTTKSCFDDLRVGPEHVSRRPTDTYYIDPTTVSLPCPLRPLPCAPVAHLIMR